MLTITSQTTVQAPPEVVFGLVNTPRESVRSGQSQSFSNITPLDNGGHEYDYTFRMAGVPLTGTVRTTAHEAPAHLTLSYTGDIDATIAFEFEQDATETTRLRAEATYEMPNRVVETVAGPVVTRYNQRELDGFLENTRERVEAHYDPTGTEYGSYSLGDAPWTPEPEPAAEAMADRAD